MIQTSAQVLTTAREINQACKTGRVYLARKSSGEPTENDPVLRARTVRGVVQIQLGLLGPPTTKTTLRF